MTKLAAGLKVKDLKLNKDERILLPGAPQQNAQHGMRAPDAYLTRLGEPDKEFRFYDLFGDARWFTVLFFAGDLINVENQASTKVKRQEAARRSVAIPSDHNFDQGDGRASGGTREARGFVDHKGEAYERFGAGPELATEGAVVVRPDDYVGAAIRIDDSETLNRYFDGSLIPM
ncbi:hypothetical protein BC937DRAFT_95612 [Endogone sp. FLAS-F59071]|nr:hypothetical protein BC937DRAFT_95612 [Endogone sp. FLAS-F59071]|eukprot:RUS20238.1 hypothetical protein BC937DRAFT_95612 [Endogone sp. FLAS-F59071]